MFGLHSEEEKKCSKRICQSPCHGSIGRFSGGVFQAQRIWPCSSGTAPRLNVLDVASGVGLAYSFQWSEGV